MKNLANCTPTEFLKQTNRIKKQAEKWLSVTDIMNIRKRTAELEPVNKDMDKEEARARIARNIDARDSQALKNLSAMYDAACGEHPAETLELMALCCFVEPEDIDNYPITYYLDSVTEMLNNESVLGFFTSLMRLGVLVTPN